MISSMGDKDGNGLGSFLLLDQDMKVKGTWSKETTRYGWVERRDPEGKILKERS
jgi:hypothetical protein